VIWGAGLGLNGAVDDGVERITDAGFDHVVVSHADLARPDGSSTSLARAPSRWCPTAATTART
jgi:2-phospho-L-lactate guanylyltransferase